MKRFSLVAALVALAALAVTTVGFAKPAAPTGRTTAGAAKLPALPANIKARGRWNIGVKCDVPPFGYIDVRGKTAGSAVETARQFARYAFGKGTSVNLLCAPTASREPLLTNDRADLV